MIEQAFLENCIKRFKEYKTLGDKTFLLLSDEEMHANPQEANSIAIIIQHMHGNMLSRWTSFLTEDGEKDWRQRDNEFEIHSFSKEELLALWEKGWEVCLQALSALKEDDLMKIITIRTKPLVVVDAVLRQLAHYSYHVGQIVYIGKWLRGPEWKSLSIPKKGSAEFNEQMRK
jgi:hypothetical protein